MRSKIAKRILDKTPQEVKDKVQDYANKLILYNVMQRTFKVGDKVEIIANIPFQLKDKPKPLLGTITNIDGWYILVRPKFQRYECEFYSSELKYVA